MKWLFRLGPRDGGDGERRADDTAVELDGLAFSDALTERRPTQLRRHYEHAPHTE